MAQERILVLESDPATLEQICNLLGSAGYSVIPASSRAQALAVEDPASLDLCLVDLNVRNKSGLAVFQELRRKNPTLSGVALGRRDGRSLAAAALRQGFGGLVLKPFEDQELLSTVSASLEQEKLKRENARLRAIVPLHDLSRAFMGTIQLDQVLDQIVATAREETNAQVVSLMLVEEDGRTLRIAAASGLAPEIVANEHPLVGAGIAGWVAEQGRPLIIGEGIPLEQSVREAMGKPELLSALSLPLQVRGETIGVLNLARKQGGEPFKRGDLELASVLAGQAAVAIDKAQLIEDMQALIDTSQRLASALDLEEAATVILEAAAHAAQAQRAALWLVEELSGELTLFKLYDLEPEDAYHPDPSSLHAGGVPLVDEGRGVLWLPITRGDAAFGLIELHNDGMLPRPGRAGLLATITHTAAAVIDSHRLRAREAIAFRELGDALRSELNLQQVLERVLTQMVEACGGAGGTIFLLGDRSDAVEAAANVGEAAPAEIAWQVIHENKPLLLSRYSDPDHKMIRSVIAAPMNVGSRVEGAVVLHSRQAGAFAARHQSLLTVLSNSSAHIVRNAQLYARSEEAVISEERTRIAREIHDGLAQDLALLLLKVEIMRRLLQKNEVEQLEKEFEEMTAALRNDVREVRRTIFALRPLDLESLGFLPALDKFVAEFGQAHDIRTHLVTAGDGATLTPKLQTALFRLTQEALNNIRKHARASNVWIELEIADGWAALRVRDDGRGFELVEALPEARRRGSVGLLQMQERAERAGGSFDLRTAPGQGTLIHVRLPIK